MEHARKPEQPIFRGDAEDFVELRQLLAGQHRILYQGTSPYQEVLVLESNNIRMYLNNQLQFSSLDERIYHEALVHPAMLLARSHKRVLVVGGNDGLIAREVLKYHDVERVCLVDVDLKLLQVLQGQQEIVDLNGGALSDNRIHLHTDFEKFLKKKRKKYDVIIVDFLDPADKAISLKYRRKVFRRLSRHLASNGILVCQAHSPQDAPLVFWSIGLTLESAGLQTLSYHVNVPTFGDWGFHLASKEPLTWRRKAFSIPSQTLPADITPWFDFHPEVLSLRKQAVPNTKNNLILHKLYAASMLSPEGNPFLLEQHDGGACRERAGHHKLKDKPKLYGDAEDLIELRQLLAGPHRVLYRGTSKEYDILLVEAEDLRMYLDQQLQFSSLDEGIYHEALVHPALTLAPKRGQILIVGGGDGLALREVLKYPDVTHVDLVDIDPLVLSVADNVTPVISLNSGSLRDKRVKVHPRDAQVFIQGMRELYNIIIVDLPDPADEVVSRLYTREFFSRLAGCLTQTGILVCQSHSPAAAPLVFWSIGQTLNSAGLKTLSYHINVPSFGDWGFHLAARQQLLWLGDEVPAPVKTLPRDLGQMFHFSAEIQSIKALAMVNRLHNLILHQIFSSEVGEANQASKGSD